LRHSQQHSFPMIMNNTSFPAIIETAGEQYIYKNASTAFNDTLGWHYTRRSANRRTTNDERRRRKDDA
ncbi:MAG: hypothetical protein M3120_09125, partial [Pseudomonadota bacterium]|nr:hypothetical protein [Pseudomonadota bacterium]